MSIQALPNKPAPTRDLELLSKLLQIAKPKRRARTVLVCHLLQQNGSLRGRPVAHVLHLLLLRCQLSLQDRLPLQRMLLRGHLLGQAQLQCAASAHPASQERSFWQARARRCNCMRGKPCIAGGSTARETIPPVLAVATCVFCARYTNSARVKRRSFVVLTVDTIARL